MRRIPSGSEALDELRPIIPLIHTAIDSAAQRAREYFDQRGEEVDPYLAPHLVRYVARRYLLDVGQAVDVEPQDLPNNGLCLTFGRFHIRVWKTEDGLLPPVGPSKPRQDFYNQRPHWQPPLPFLGELPPEAEDERVNLAVLWHTTRRYSLDGLVLACPGKADTNGVSAHWYERVPDPLMAITPAPATDGDSDVPDLPLARLDERLDGDGLDETGTEPNE